MSTSQLVKQKCMTHVKNIDIDFQTFIDINLKLLEISLIYAKALNRAHICRLAYILSFRV